MFPPQHPSSIGGQLEAEMGRLRNEIDRKANSYEISEINRKLDSLQRECGELRSEVDGILSRLQNVEENKVDLYPNN